MCAKFPENRPFQKFMCTRFPEKGPLSKSFVHQIPCIRPQMALWMKIICQIPMKRPISRESGAQRFLRGVHSQGIWCTKVFERGVVSITFVRQMPCEWTPLKNVCAPNSLFYKPQIHLIDTGDLTRVGQVVVPDSVYEALIGNC
jgi:hypothetical protein